MFQKEETFLMDKDGNCTFTRPITSIKAKKFRNNHRLQDIKLPDKLTHINHATFQNCTQLTNVVFPSSLTRIGPRAFSNCIKLTGISLSPGVTHIDSYAFENCENLTNMTLPASLIKIGYEAFVNCPNLTLILIDVANDEEKVRIMRLIPKELRYKVMVKSDYLERLQPYLYQFFSPNNKIGALETNTFIKEVTALI